MSTQVRTWTEYCGAGGRALALGSVHQRPPRAGRLYRENRRRVRDPLSTPSPQKAHHPRGGEAQPGAGPTDFNSWPESGKDSRRGQRPHLVCRSWRDTRRESLPRECHGGLGVLPGRRDNGKILVDRAAAEQKAAQGLPEGPQGKFANLFLFYAPAGERTQYVAELEADDADSIERARAFAQEVMEDESEDAVEVRDYLRMRNFLRRHENEFEFARSVFGDLVEERARRASLRIPETEA